MSERKAFLMETSFKGRTNTKRETETALWKNF